MFDFYYFTIYNSSGGNAVQHRIIFVYVTTLIYETDTFDIKSIPFKILLENNYFNKI